jgi:hypothetical protein
MNDLACIQMSVFAMLPIDQAIATLKLLAIEAIMREGL